MLDIFVRYSHRVNCHPVDGFVFCLNFLAQMFPWWLASYHISSGTPQKVIYALQWGIYTRGGQNNGDTKKLRNIICLCWLQWKNFSWQHWMLFRLFTLCSARVSALMSVLSDSPCEGIEKWETCSILKEGRLLLHVQLEHVLQQLPHY
jgi:hypothetical protein